MFIYASVSIFNIIYRVSTLVLFALVFEKHNIFVDSRKEAGGGLPTFLNDHPELRVCNMTISFDLII